MNASQESGDQHQAWYIGVEANGNSYLACLLVLLFCVVVGKSKLQQMHHQPLAGRGYPFTDTPN